MPTVDSLDIRISAQANTASASIDKLVGKLNTLSNALIGINGSSFSSFSNAMKNLSDGMKNLQGIKAKDFTHIANGIKKFENLDTNKISSIGGALQPLANGISTLSNTKFDNTNLQSIINGLTRLSNVNVSGLANVDFTAFGNSIKTFVNSLSGAEKVQQSTISMTNAVANLAKTGANIPTVASSLPQLSTSLKGFINSMSGASAVSSSTISFTQAIAQLSNAGTKMTATANGLGTLATELKKFMQEMSNAPAVSNNVIQTTNALAILARQGGKAGTVSGSLGLGIKSVSNSMSKLKESTNGAMTKLKSFSKQLLASLGIYITLRQAIKGLADSIKSSMDYVETLNYFNAAFEQVAKKADLGSWKRLGYESAEAYYNSFSERAEKITQKMTGFRVSESGMPESTGMKNLGLNPSEVMNYQAMFGQMASSMGIVSENAIVMSDVLTKIGADIASVKNMDFNKVWTDMASGLAGMSRTLDKYGVNIRNVNLQQKLNELGINASITALNQNDKALLRTIILLENTGYAWSDMSDTINQPSNQLRLLKANLSNLARTIGNIFLPIVANALPYLNAFVIALQRLSEQIVKMLGFEDFEWGGLGGGNTDLISNLYDEADAFDNVSESAKKASDNLQGFDKINKLSDNSTGDTSGFSGIDSSKLSNEFNRLSQEYLKAWEKSFEKVEQKSQKLADSMQKSFEGLIQRISAGDFEGIGSDISSSISSQLEKVNWGHIYKGASNFGKGLAEFLNGLISPKLFDNVGKTIAGSLNTALQSLNSFGTKFDWKNFGNSIATGINNFFSTFNFALLANAIDAWVQGLADFIISFVSKIDLGKILKGTWDFLRNIDIETVGIAISAITITLAAKKIKEAVTTMLLPVITKWFSKNSSKFLKIGIAVTVATISLKIAKDKLEPIFNENNLEEIKKASEEMFKDWFGENPISVTFSDMFVFTSALIAKPSEILEGLKLLWDEVCSGDFKFNLFNLIEFPSYNEISDALSLLLKDISKGDFELSIFKPEWKLPSVKDFKQAWKLFKQDIDYKDFKLSIFKPEWELPSWSDISDGVTDIANRIENWWNYDVAIWFTIEKWKGLFGNVKKGFVNGWNTVKEWWNKTAIVNWWSKNVSPWFAKEKWTFSGIKEGLKAAFNSAISSVKAIWNGFATWINDALSFEFEGFSKKLNVMGKDIEIGIPSFNINLGKLPTFQAGGFPEDGLFMANHNELVGRFSNGKTAVANNEQIIAGIRQAAYEGMARALAERSDLLKVEVNLSLEGDMDELFTAIQRKSRKYKAQTKRAPFPT